jgi:formamidopyrimidine-DNA glycosylase
MIEYAEAKYITSQIDFELRGKMITHVEVNRNPHHLAWFNQDVEDYIHILEHAIVKESKSNGSMMRIILESGDELILGEDIVFSYHDLKKDIGKNQLLLYFDNDMVLEVKAKLYGFFLLGKMEDLMTSNPYLRSAIQSIGVYDRDFSYEYFIHSTRLLNKKGSVKEALATDQHLPGIGNGTLQDVLFDAKIRPERKVATLSETEKKNLFQSLIQKTKVIFEHGGRDSTTDLFGRCGGYKVMMSNAQIQCPTCHSELVKKAYLGGKVIYCPNCQT